MKIIKKLGKVIIASALLIGFTANVHAAAATESEMYYVLSDHLGTPEMLVDKDQHVVWKASYDEFGKATILVEEVEFNLRLPGQYYDKEKGTHYNYYRDYNPELGGYTQPDPIGILKNFNDPQMQVAMQVGIPLNQDSSSFSRLNHVYSYVENNPLRYVDPFGLVGTLNSDNSKRCASAECGMYGGTEPSNASHPAMQCPAFPENDPHVKCKVRCMVVTTTCGLTDGPLLFAADMACGAVLGKICFNYCDS